MVRFKLDLSAIKKEKQLKSQFHYGSIQTDLKNYYELKTAVGHNSTMVRFKQYISMCKNMHFYLKIKYFVEKFFRKFSQT